VFEFSAKTVQEFKLKKTDIPPNFKSPFDSLRPHSLKDFLSQNAQLSQHFNEVSKATFLSRLKQSLDKQESARDREQTFFQQRRASVVNKQQKWRDFRARRAQAIESYLAQRRICLMLESLLRLKGLLDCLKVLQTKLEAQKQLRKRQFLMQWLKVHAIVYCRVSNRQYRGLFGKFQAQIKSSFSLVGSIQIHSPSLRAKSLSTFRESVEWMGLFFGFKLKLESTRQRVVWMQTQLRDRLVCKRERRKLLHHHWDRLAFKLAFLASTQENSRLKEVLAQVELIPQAVKHFTIEQYCQQAHCLRQLKFLKQRRQKALADSAQIKRMETRFKTQLRRFASELRWPNPLDALKGENLLKGLVDAKTLEQFGILGREQSSGVMVRSLSQIGWPDPFPEALPLEDFISKKGKVNAKFEKLHKKLLAQEQLSAASRLGEAYLSVLALPSDASLFKIMRACIGVEQASDLWIFRVPID
jgi:hypothetical protein